MDGGSAGTLVKVTLTSGQGIVTPSDYAYADATSGSIAFQPICSGLRPVFCTLGLPASDHAQVTVEVSPAPGNATILAAPGITGTVSASWTYRYIFGGLSLN
jgi:hypothetical protein